MHYGTFECDCSGSGHSGKEVNASLRNGVGLTRSTQEEARGEGESAITLDRTRSGDVSSFEERIRFAT